MIRAVIPQYGISADRAKKLLDPNSYESMNRRDEPDWLSHKLLTDAVEQLRFRVMTLETEVLELKRGKL